MHAEIDRFIHWVRRHSPQARTWKDYQYDLRIFARFIGNRLLRELTFRDVDRFVALQVARGVKPATISRRLVTVVSLHAFLSDGDSSLLVAKVRCHDGDELIAHCIHDA